MLDAPISNFVERVAKPAVFWLPANLKASAPFATSMWARLPWRLLTAGAAIATGTEAGLIFALANLAWALGDIAIGALEAPELEASASLA